MARQWVRECFWRNDITRAGCARSFRVTRGGYAFTREVTRREHSTPSKPVIEWNGSRWVGIDVPDYAPTTKPSDGVGPFIMNAEGVGRLFARDQMVEGPFPEHYEPLESPVPNVLHPKITSNPVADPPEVGGTHVMYVLHHADRPSLYAGLPDKPHISAFVTAWKGLYKPVALAGIAFAAIAGFFHWVVAGPNEVQPEDEAKARRLLRAGDDPR